MKKVFTFVFCILFIATMSVPAFASETTGKTVYYSKTVLDNGITVVDEVIDLTSRRSTDKTYARTATFSSGGSTIACITICGTFQYDGTSVSVISKSVTRTDTYDGWSYSQNSFSSSGGTITLNAKLTKLLVVNVPITMTLSCDKDGNISYT